MSRTLDIEKVDAALKRAAERAIHSTREERSGRFLPAQKRRIPPAGRTPRQRDVSRRKARVAGRSGRASEDRTATLGRR